MGGTEPVMLLGIILVLLATAPPSHLQPLMKIKHHYFFKSILSIIPEHQINRVKVASGLFMKTAGICSKTVAI